MKTEILERLSALVWHTIPLVDGSRLVDVWPLDQKNWPSVHLANHNVFRLGPNNEVIWQVRRVENATRLPWDELHAFAIQKHAEGANEGNYSAMGYLDPFWSMGMDERAAITAEPKGVYRPGCVIGLRTKWTEYTLDPETGIATCTGQQLK